MAGSGGRPIPAFVFPNHRDLTYAKVELDPESVRFVMDGMGRIDDPLTRQLLWSSLWSMVRDRTLSSLRFLDLAQRELPGEGSVEILRIVTARARRAVAAYVPAERKQQAARDWFAVCRSALDEAEPGDARVIWARAMIAAATDPADLAVAAPIVDEEEAIEGLRIDQEMRWDLAVAFSAHGMPGAEERVAAEERRDPSDRGRRAVLRAGASRPDLDVKVAVWERIHEHGYRSLHEMIAAMRGFGWDHQQSLLEPYAAEFFDRVTEVFAAWEWEEAKAYFGALFPSYRIERDTVVRARSLLEDTGEVRLRRLLAEEIDELRRALACRELAALEAPAAPPGASTEVGERLPQ